MKNLNLMKDHLSRVEMKAINGGLRARGECKDECSSAGCSSGKNV